MRLKAKVGPKFQVVIPKEFRDALRIRKGDVVVFELRDGELLLKRHSGGKTVEELFTLIPEERKLKEKVNLKEIILSETNDRWLT